MSDFVGAQHEFHDAQYARDWANLFVPTPERLQLFDAIIKSLVEGALPSRHIVELGIGPGYFATCLLERVPDVTYEGVDFSRPMLELASSRLKPYSSRVRLTQGDLVVEDWGSKISRPVGAIVSTWALHDLGGEANTMKVYQACRAVLPPGGVLLNGDFVKPHGTKHEYEPGRFLISRHIEILREIGFRDVQCLVCLEIELENPTPAQNYACFRAVK